MIKTKILKKISQQQLDKKLKLNLENKYVEGEQWFKNPELWYELTAFSNPYITVYSELVLLIQNLDKISRFLSNRVLVFYGLGTGDTEIILVNSMLKKEKSTDVVGLEVQAQFIDGFIQSIQNISLENDDYKINFLGIHGLFQDTKKEDLKISDKKQAHIILGNTIGNFKEDEIFQIFNELMNQGDILLIGFQTDENMNTVFKQYSENKMFNNFIRKTIPNCTELKWKINETESQIEAWSNDVLVFHSKKKSPTSMINCVEDFGFKKRYGINDNNSCIQIFEKS
jgi:hypothetical protein